VFLEAEKIAGSLMTIDPVLTQPLTTPQFPDPAEAIRYIDDPDGFYGHDYVFLEDAAWHALCEIACERGCTVDELCSDIDLNFAPGEPFAPAARLYVLRYVADRLPQSAALPPELLFLRELGDRERLQ
jgi:predicted DNA-binding ribbon-helix-helix protein